MEEYLFLEIPEIPPEIEAEKIYSDIEEIKGLSKEEIEKRIELENILNDVCQAFKIPEGKIRRIEELISKGLEINKEKVERIIEKNLLGYTLDSLLSFYKSIGMRNKMENLLRNVAKKMPEEIAKNIKNLESVLGEYKNEIRETFNARKGRRRSTYHDKRLKETFENIKKELEGILKETNIPIEKKFIDLYIEIARELLQKDEISYYNMVWTFGFILRVIDFEKKDRSILGKLYRLFKDVHEKLKSSANYREISNKIKEIFFYISYNKKLLEVPEFINKLLRKKNLEERLNDALKWLKEQKSYRDPHEIARKVYEDLVEKELKGKLEVGIEKILETCLNLESLVREYEKIGSLTLIHSLLFHQRSIQYVLLKLRSYLEKHRKTKMEEDRERIKKERKKWLGFLENPQSLCHHLEDVMEEFYMYIGKKELGEPIKTLRSAPLISISPYNLEYPKSFLAILNYWLKEEKVGVSSEMEVKVKVNDKYTLKRKIEIGKDDEGRVYILEKVLDNEYKISSISIPKKIKYKEFLEEKVKEVEKEKEKIDKEIEGLKESIGVIEELIRSLMVYDVEGFIENLREGLIMLINRYIEI